METIECSKCGAIFEKTGAKDKLRRFKDKRFMTTFHCPNCDARVILKNGDEPISIYLKRLERLKEQARRLGDRQEVNELQDEIDQINREIKMNAGKTKDKKFSMKGNDAYDPTKPKNIAKAKALSVAQGKAASDAKDDVNYLGEKVFHTYESWKVACKRVNPNVVFEGDRDICEAKPGVGQWDGVTGVIYKTDDEAYDPLDPENIAEEKELAKARGAAAADEKIISINTPKWSGDIKIVDNTHFEMKAEGTNKWSWAYHIGQADDHILNALKAKGMLKDNGRFFITDSLFKGQKVTAIKSERGLREGETYTVLGEEAIIKQVVGEGNTIVYKLQDSSGNVIVIENPEGLFYEVKDSKTKDKYELVWQNSKFEIYEDENNEFELVRKSNKAIIGQYATIQGAKLDAQNSWQDDWKSGKLDNGTKDPEEENESLKVKIGDIRKNMDAARKMGYDTEPYQKEIDKLEAKDSLSYVTTYKGYEIASSDKNIADKFLTTSKGTFLAANTLEELKKKIDKQGTKDESEILRIQGLSDNNIINLIRQYQKAKISSNQSKEYRDLIWEATRRGLSVWEIVDKKTKDDNSKNGYYAAMTGKARTENPFTKGTPEYVKWDSDWKIGREDFKYESNKELFKPKDSDNKELKEMLVNDAPDYYGAIVATARRGNNPRMGGAELRKNIEPFMTAHGVQFNEEEFNKAYKEFSHAGVSKAAFMKGTDAKTKDALMECMECGHKFKKNLSSNTFEVKCPKCGGYDVEVISGDSKDSSDVYTKDPLTKKGEKILAAMKKIYGEEKGEQIFYASRNKGTISGVDKKMKDAKGDISYYKHFNIIETGMGDFLAQLEPSMAAFYVGKPSFTGRSMIEVKSLIDQWHQTHGKDSKTKDQKIDKKFIASCPACQEMRAAGLSYEETHSSHTPGMILVEVNGREKEIPNPHITKDQEIKIIIGDDPVNPSPAEQKVEGNDVIYKEYTLKQLPETGEFEIYAPGGSIVGHAKALELAKLFVDRIVASRVGDEWSEEARKKL